MYFSFLLFIGQKLTQIWRLKSVLRINIFPLNLLSCVQKVLKNIQTKFNWDRMKHKHFIEVSNICPTITLSSILILQIFFQCFRSCITLLKRENTDSYDSGSRHVVEKREVKLWISRILFVSPWVSVFYWRASNHDHAVRFHSIYGVGKFPFIYLNIF